jgi:flagellar hook protein FlgE
VLANPRTGRAGEIEGSALEISTVDIGREFSTLIETQRAYATNARIITTADELWRTLVETAA